MAWFYAKIYDRAIEDATRALEINPYYSIGANQLAWMLATCPDPQYRDGKKAVALAEKVVDRFPEANFMDTLAAAYAEAGNMEGAVRVQRLAVERLRGEMAVSDPASFEKRLNAYGQAIADSGQIETPASQDAARSVYRVETPGLDGPAVAPAMVPLATTSALPAHTGRQADTGSTDDGHQRFSVHLSSFRHQKLARKEALALSQGGTPAFICLAHVDSDPVPWFRVYGGAFDNLQAAQEYARDLKDQGRKWARAVVLPDGSTTVKIGH